MNWFWDNEKMSKVGIYNAKDLRERLGLSLIDFNKLIDLEAERYRRYLLTKYGRPYYDSKVEENPFLTRYGGTPVFKPHPAKTPSFIFNNESGMHLEKTWSKSNKYNTGKNLPFNFTFKP